MVTKIKTFVAILGLSPFLLCQPSNPSNEGEPPPTLGERSVRVGAERMEEYRSLLEGRRVGLVVNHTSRVGARHLVDTLTALGIEVRKVFAPEHGFRGTADAGERIEDGVDARSGARIVSLYGRKKKPAPEDLADLDIVVYDIQDVGARFYTYISTMHYVMEACAENAKPFLLLDRPNPNGHYVDGPVLDPAFRSFVGMHPIPVVYGMTPGELARMILGEGWLNTSRPLDLTVIPCENYSHRSFYELPVPPSPNLPNMRSVYLYPSLCFFEATAASVGRGTDLQFQVVGAPGFPAGDYTF
ncbi:MAG: DUF1343 domain-containing protein, partial [Bacteroidetes bacterium]